jgi:hypothetical protein
MLNIEKLVVGVGGLEGRSTVSETRGRPGGCGRRKGGAGIGARIYERRCEWSARCPQMRNLAVQPVSGRFES